MDKINFDHINVCDNSKDAELNCNDLIDAQADAFHFSGRKAKAFMEQVRINFATQLNVLPAELYFSGNYFNQSVHLINFLVLFANVRDVLTSIFEPEEWISYLKKLEKAEKIKIHWIKTGKFGEIDLLKFQEQLKQIKKQALVSLSHANEYNGLLIPVKEIVKACQQENKLFLLNLKATIGKYKLDLENLKPDFACIDLSELGGGRNNGIFYISSKLNVPDLIFHELKSNLQTIENKDTYSICKLNEALKELNAHFNIHFKSINTIKNYFIEAFYRHFKIKNIISDYHKEGMYTLLTYFFPEKDFGKFPAQKLDIENILIGEINYPIKQEKGTFIRFSFGKQNTKKEIDLLISSIKRLINKT